MPSVNSWIPFVSMMIVIFIQTVAFAFFMGRLAETVASCKRRIQVLEDKPVISHEAKLASIDTTLTNLQENMKSSETRMDERFKSLEGTFRNMVQLATSPQNSRRSIREG